MLIRTHLAFVILLIMIFVRHVSDKPIFIIVALIATILPDIDTGFSHVGHKWYLKPVQIFVKHRGIIHSLTMAVFLSVLISIFYPVLSLGFFLGYSVHLFMDSFTKDGIQPFWPLKYKTSGPVKTGGRIEMSLFVTIVLVDILIFIISLIK